MSQRANLGGSKEVFIVIMLVSTNAFHYLWRHCDMIKEKRKASNAPYLYFYSKYLDYKGWSKYRISFIMFIVHCADHVCHKKHIFRCAICDKPDQNVLWRYLQNYLYFLKNTGLYNEKDVRQRCDWPPCSCNMQVYVGWSIFPLGVI